MLVLKQKIAAVLADPLAASRAADRPVGYVGFDMPLDIMYATERSFFHLPWQAGRATPEADKWLESSFPGWAFSLLEDWINGVFDHFDSVVFTRSDDAAQRLYYYLCEMQRRGIVSGPTPRILDAALIPRESSVRHCMHAISNLMTELEMDADSLEGGITRANNYRTVYGRLEQFRAGPGHLFENIARASLFCDLYPQLQDLQFPVQSNTRRVVLTGSAPPDDRMHITVEASGWTIGADTHQRSLLRHGPPLECLPENALNAVAKRLNSSAYALRSFSSQTSRMMAEASRIEASAVVLWVTAEDEALAWHIAQQRLALEAAEIPALILTHQRWGGQEESLDSITQFFRELDA